MRYTDTERFKHHALMRNELREVGIAIPRYCKSEAELVHLYDITFLVNFKLQSQLQNLQNKS